MHRISAPVYGPEHRGNRHVASGMSAWPESLIAVITAQTTSFLQGHD